MVYPASENQHCVAVTVEPVLVCDCHPVGFLCEFRARYRGTDYGKVNARVVHLAQYFVLYMCCPQNPQVVAKNLV